MNKLINNTQKNKSTPGKVIAWAIIVLLVIGTTVGIGIRVNRTSTERQDAYNLYRQSPNATVAFENLDYEDTFDIWNNKDLGNDVNALLTGGLVYVRNQSKMFPSGEGFTLVIADNAGNEDAVGISASFLNVVDNTLYFRNNTDRSIYAYDLGTETACPILIGNVGEVFVSNGLIYYIDYDLDCTIQAVTLSGENKRCIVGCPVLSFIICGDCVIYLDTNSDLYYAPFNAETQNKLVGNIERFVVGDRIYAESENTIFSFTPTGGNAKEEYNSNDNSLRLVGYWNGCIFYQESGQLKFLSDGISTTVCSDKYACYTSPVGDGTGTLYTIAYTPESGWEILSFPQFQSLD